MNCFTKFDENATTFSIDNELFLKKNKITLAFILKWLYKSEYYFRRKIKSKK